MESERRNSVSLPAVILAAGESRRMGRMKPLLPLGSRTLLQWVADSLIEAGIDPIWVVLGHRADEVKTSLEGRPVKIAVNERYLEGMLSSVQFGVSQVSEEPAMLLALGDQPGVPASVVHTLVAAWRENPGTLVVPTFEGKRGHPILIDRRYFSAILALKEPQTLREVVHSPDTVRLEVPVASDGPLIDLDTPEDYEAALRSGRFSD